MGNKDKAPKGPDWKDLMSKIEPLISQNQDLFKEAMSFGKDQFSKGEEFVKRITDFGMDASGKLGDMATDFKTTSDANIGKMQGIADKFSQANLSEFGRAQGMANQITGALMPGIKNQAQLGNELTDRYRTQGVPYEDQYLAKLRGWDTPERQAAAAAQAVGDISMATEAAKNAELQRLESYGIDPSQTRSAALDARLQAQNAITKAAGANQARQRVEQEGLQAGASAVDIANKSAQLGSNLGGAAATQGTSAAAIGAAPGTTFMQGLGALGNFQQGIAQTQQAAGSTGYNMQQGASQFGMGALGAGATQQNAVSQYGSGVYSQGSDITGQSANMLGSAYGTAGQLNMNDLAAADFNNKNSFWGGVGSLVGTLGPAAIGAINPAAGAVAGAAAGAAGGGAAAPAPQQNFWSNLKGKFGWSEGGAIPESMSPSGGKVPDDVPALLSPNEYVLDEATVRWHGMKAISKLQQDAKAGLTGIPADGGRKRKKAA